MTEFWKFAILGLGVGGIYALAAQGLVLVYRGSGVVNFASGAVALVAAYMDFEFTSSGMPRGLSIILATMIAALLGVGIHVIVMRPLRGTSPLTRLVATFGVLTVLSGLVEGKYGETPHIIKSRLPTDSLDLSGIFGNGVQVGADRLWLVAIGGLVAAVCSLTYRYTQFGVSTRAVAENQFAVSVVGRSPDRIAAMNWAAGSALSGLAGILLVPIVGLAPSQLVFLVIPALAAALVGGFSSFMLTWIGGLLIGVFETVITSNASFLPDLLREPGWGRAVPFVVIIVALIISGRALPERGFVQELRPQVGTGRVRWRVVVVALLIGTILLVGPFGIGPGPISWIDALITTLVLAIIALSLVVVTGYAGQLSLAQFALAGVGAYIAGRLASGTEPFCIAAGKKLHCLELGLGTVSFPLALLLGALFTIPIGMLVALPALRTRGVNQAITTLGFALIVERVVFGNALYSGGYTGVQVKPPTILGIDLNPVTHPGAYAMFTLVVFTALALAVANVRRGRSGRRLLAMRANERAAAALGISVKGAKLYAFGLGAAIASVGGTLLAFRVTNLNFLQFGVFPSINLIVISVLCGIGFIGGSFAAGNASPGGFIAVIGLGEIFKSVGTVFTIPFGLDIDVTLPTLFGALFIFALVRRPDGVASHMAERFGRRLDRLSRRRRIEPWKEEDVRAPAARVRAQPMTVRVENLSVRFGAVVAVDDLSFVIEPGEILGLIGPNGAGKTTVLDVISGFTPQDAGDVFINEQAVSSWSPQRRARAGIGRSFQALELFEDMTVRDNLRAASDGNDSAAYIVDLVWPRNPPLTETVVAAVDEFGLGDVLDLKPTDLSYGDRRLVAIARAIAADASVVLLDEPTSGLDEHATSELGKLVRRLASEWGIGVLLIEHDVALVAAVCDRVIALDFGQKIAEGTPKAVLEDPAVVLAYLGNIEPSDEEDDLSTASEARVGIE